MNTLVFTGGHHISALAVVDCLRDRGWNIVWFGHRYSMWGDTADSAEYTEVTARRIPFYDLRAGKGFRTFHPLKLFRIPFGFIQAFYYLLRLKPVGIVSFGGYLSVPTVIAGWFMGIPSITHEQTTTAGWANKLITFFVCKIAISWATSYAHFPPQKTVLTGLPIRKNLMISSSNKRTKNLIYVTGGKQGSHAINKIIFTSLPRLVSKYRLIHQTGASHLTNDFTKAQAYSQQFPHYQVFDFDSQKAIKALSQCSCVVSRAGAHIVYELALLNIPCVLIPLPNSSRHEQQENAAILKANQQAVIINQSELEPNRLLESIARALTLKPQPMRIPLDATEKLTTLIESTFVHA